MLQRLQGRGNGFERASDEDLVERALEEPIPHFLPSSLGKGT